MRRIDIKSALNIAATFNIYAYDAVSLGDKIQKWRNSQGLRLSKSLLAETRLGVGDKVDIRVKAGIMIVTPAKKIRGKYSLKDLVARIPEDYRSGEVDRGEPVGREEW